LLFSSQIPSLFATNLNLLAPRYRNSKR